jgi:tetratricopeptide (TPR) repeat protein
MPPKARSHPLPWLASGLLLLLAACASQGTRQESRIQQVDELIRQIRYDEAMEQASRLLEAAPEEPALQDLHRRAVTAWLLDRGRTASFDDRDLEALELFERAQALSPDSRLVQSWVDKTRSKIATAWLERAFELHAKTDLRGAIAAYRKALEYVPGHRVALRGIEDTGELIEHREGLGSRYYTEGVMALADYWLGLARHSFSSTVKYVPENERAGSRRQETDELMAERRVDKAWRLEEQGLYAAALSELRLALKQDPKNQAAASALKRVEPEHRAAQLLRQADMLLRRKRYDEALERIRQAALLTERQQEVVVEKQRLVQDRRLDNHYQRARSLERDQQYPEAILAYDELFQLGEYYKDARTRQSTLQEYVQRAEDYYQRAMASEDLRERLDLLRAIRGFWFDYSDIATRIAALEAELGPEEGEEEDWPQGRPPG